MNKLLNIIYFIETKELEISELTEVGVPFAIPAATDKDSSKFGIQRYILETSFNNFELEVGFFYCIVYTRVLN